MNGHGDMTGCRSLVGWCKMLMSLTCITFLDIFSCVLLYCLPIVTVYKDISEEWPAPCMVSVFSFIDFHEDYFGFDIFEIPKISRCSWFSEQDSFNYVESWCIYFESSSLYFIFRNWSINIVIWVTSKIWLKKLIL